MLLVGCVIGVYLFFIVLFYVLSKQKQRFQTQKSWWQNGLSLFAVEISIATPLIYSGLYSKEGIGGLWLLWSAFLVSGFLPFVFAPLWARLKFVTDNQFIRFRFSGKGAKILHLFRAIYVGWLICAFLLSFHFLSFLKIIAFFTEYNRDVCFIVIALLLLFLAFKNSLHLNIKLDVFNAICILGGFLCCCTYLYLQNTTPNPMQPIHSIFPENTNYFWVLLFIKPWSVDVFDGSGMSAQRYWATKKKNNTFKVALLNTGLHLLFALLLIGILYLGNRFVKTTPGQDGELFILALFQNQLPLVLQLFLALAFLGSFLSSFQGLLNWGASFLSVDVYQTYIKPNSNTKKTGQIAILLILITSFFCTYFSTSLTGLIQFLFSISAGVFPVFVLRWFWFRINAYTQLSAMIGSGIYTLVYKNVLKHSTWEIHWMETLHLNSYSIQLCFVTLFTVISWLLITFITPKDDVKHLQTFQTTAKPLVNLKKNLYKALGFGVLVVGGLILSLYLLVFLN